MEGGDGGAGVAQVPLAETHELPLVVLLHVSTPGVQCAVGCILCAVCSVHWTVDSGQWAVGSVQCAVCSVQCAVCSVQCAVCSVQPVVRVIGYFLEKRTF